MYISSIIWIRKRQLDQEGTIILCIYVLNALIIRNKRAIKKTESQLRNKVFLKGGRLLNKYVDCPVVGNPNREELIMCKPDLLKTLKRTFKDRIAGIRFHETLAILGEIVVKTTKENKIVDKESYRVFRSGVGMRLYIIKYSKPDIANTVR
jgi:hypothetical protein